MHPTDCSLISLRATPSLTIPTPPCTVLSWRQDEAQVNVARDIAVQMCDVFEQKEYVGVINVSYMSAVRPFASTSPFLPSSLLYLYLCYSYSFSFIGPISPHSCKWSFEWLSQFHALDARNRHSLPIPLSLPIWFSLPPPTRVIRTLIHHLLPPVSTPPLPGISTPYQTI